MLNKAIAAATAVLLVLGYAGLAVWAQRVQAPALRPGVVSEQVTLLPNGWQIAPAGRHLTVGDLPLAMLESRDGRYLIITNNGYAKPSLAVVDTWTLTVKERVPLDTAWLGLTWHPDGKRVYSAGQNLVQEFAWADGSLEPLRTFDLPESKLALGGGTSVSPDGARLFVVRVLEQTLTAIDLESGRIEKAIELPAEPYTCLLSADGKRLFVSLWGGAKVLALDPATLEITAQIPVGEHPNAIALTPDGSRLFVACANTNAVWAVDLASSTAKEQISLSLFPKAPAGTTPNALGLSRDGRTLLVANADNNTVAVVDVSEPLRSEVKGFIPTGWYPTGVMFASGGKDIYVLSGKGLQSSPDPHGQNAALARGEQYVGGLLLGALSVVPAPDQATLESLTKRVYRLTPYKDTARLTPEGAPKASPIPSRVGGPSPIKHVFYVIRENRTYDQVLGDVKRGDGDPTLCLFGEDVTPNAHALASEFVLFDNFYVDAEVSYDGHAFSTAAYATDVVEKMWPANYAGRGGAYLSEGGWQMRNPYGNVAAPADGYIWDFCKRAGVSVRSYGEFVMRGEGNRDPNGPIRASVPGLDGKINPDFPPYDLSIPDNDRIDIWLKEFRQFEADGKLPGLSILRLPRDHTAGTRPGALTPRAMVAENDVALGRLVETISKSRYWKESAIFILEDDAQNGSDHVDCHRSVLLVASPFARRGTVDSTLYTTSGVLRTIELVLGLPPMSQYDAAATPMYNAFQTTPVTTPYVLRPARIPLDEVNQKSAYGAAASLAMNLDEADRAPDLELNEIIWKAVRGEGSPMPPPRRTGFVRPVDKDDPE